MQLEDKLTEVQIDLGPELDSPGQYQLMEAVAPIYEEAGRICKIPLPQARKIKLDMKLVTKYDSIKGSYVLTIKACFSPKKFQDIA